MIKFSAYDPSKYHSLKSLNVANDGFEMRNAEDIIEKNFSELFVKHGVQNQLGMILLHRHFDIADDEKLVESGNVSTPWSYTYDDHNLYGGSVVPRSWILEGSNLHPYEFGYNGCGVTDAYPALPENMEFYTNFAKLLVEYGLSDLLGLTLVNPIDPNTVRLEKTYRHANVVYELPAKAVATDKDTVQAVWQFAEERRPDGYRVFVCISGCLCRRE